MRALPGGLRRQLEAAVVAGRRAAEAGVRAALSTLGVEREPKPAHLDEQQARLRRGLRAKQRQLDGVVDVLVWEAAYEQWHRLLFARFLAENSLLRHPQFGVPVTLDDCEELAAELGEPDGWSVAAGFAAEILPGIFRLDDPCVQLRLAPEHRLELESIVTGLPVDVFQADDSLGWVYQYWQSERRDQVNASGDKIGGADLGPVTQLFTENYMVRFLLENSLGAWWAARHPDSPLVKEFEYLRFDEDGQPAAGRFEGWPQTAAEVTVMDPCCGSGHFLVEAFGLLWRMRVEEEGLNSVAAQDAVLRDNLFGLELDPRCVQIAMFALALRAWKAGGGWRELPLPNVACSGIPVRGRAGQWRSLAGGNPHLESALTRLHILFMEADTLGSLIDPRRAVEISDPTGLQHSLDDVPWDDIAPLVEKALVSEAEDVATAVLGADAVGVARAADFLSRPYTLVATNVPYLARRHQTETLKTHSKKYFTSGAANLATTVIARFADGATPTTLAVVSPQNWLYAGTYEEFRRGLLGSSAWLMLARLGPSAFRQISGEVVDVHLSIVSSGAAHPPTVAAGIDAQGAEGADAKAVALRAGPLLSWDPSAALARNDAVIGFDPHATLPLLGEYAESKQGLATGDDPRHKRAFWEVPVIPSGWERHQSSVERPCHYGGCDLIVNYRYLVENPGGAALRGADAWGRPGVSIRQTRPFYCALYAGVAFDMNAAAVLPHDETDLPAIWEFCNSAEYAELLVALDPSLKVTNATLVKVPFDVDRWRAAAGQRYPDGLPEPWSDDPTQWLFRGRPELATEPLQVGVARLLGYRWPDQPKTDDVDVYGDEDGIVCLPAVGGELPAADRLTSLLATAYGDEWSAALARRLLEHAGSKKKTLSDWLGDDFFKHHCKVFQHRPFVWHVWDGRQDGFSALVNYHRLNRPGLEKLTYTYLGDWIEQQRVAAAEEVAAADVRLAAAKELRGRLEQILEGEPPYDIYVRWKELHEQPLGWEPDLVDGVRLNIRPFVEAGVLRAKVNVNWKKDRGKNPNGSERLNDLHYTLAEKRQARLEAELG